MKTKITTVIILALMINMHNAADAQNSPSKEKNLMSAKGDKEKIEKILNTYQDALNASSVKDVLPLYATDGQFLPTGAPSAIGKQQLKESYEHVYKTIQLHVKFHIEEIVVNGSLAFARTHSQGTTLTHATGKTSAEENRELFVFQKEDGQWKISRYMFNKTK
jgi:uncharacterized protein (TIGR02246 family)